MTNVLLIQLPIPALNYGRQTGNIPLGGACLKEAARGTPGARVEIAPESVVSYLGDAALLDWILSRRPDVVGFTVYVWNVERALHLARLLKRRYGPRILFGGPEVTPDNALIRTGDVDFFVYGDGEAIFTRLLREPDLWLEKNGARDAGAIFRSSPSPYLNGLLEPDIENMMLLETQRGCPYRCGCCYYNKSRKRLSFADEAPLLQSVRWAVEREIPELYLLDPSLNARPGLKNLLKKIAGINPDGRLAVISEIRAEGVDAELADLFAKAGFTWFEIGLQSTNPRALKILNRPTDLKRFLQGVRLLKERGISPRIDLIAGLPGDDLRRFRESVDFVAEHDLGDDVQVFPLS
ncbi:MAG: radical SAM protein, partial [Desulfobacterales bacterium]|nr:radical SAM protein [Desulfobacterales bacterium]